MAEYAEISLFSRACMTQTRLKNSSAYKGEQSMLSVDKSLFILGHVTKFVDKSHDKNHTRLMQGDLCIEKAYKAISAVCLQKVVYITWSHD